MPPFAPGDRVVAINTDLSGPIAGPADPTLHQFHFPDGPLRRGGVYHVAATGPSKDGNQGLFLTGMRVFWGPRALAWNSSRFRKVQDAGHPEIAEARERRRPRRLANETPMSRA
jgi:hypothetical protein